MNRRVFFFCELHCQKCHIVAFREQSDYSLMEAIEDDKSELIRMLMTKNTFEYIWYTKTKLLVNYLK